MKIIFLRHAEADQKGLTAKGLTQVVALNERLAAHIVTGRTRLISSTLPRAIQTAALIGERFELTPGTQSLVLSLDPSMVRSVISLGTKLIETEAEDVDVLVVVGHAEFIAHFPAIYLTERLGNPSHQPAFVDNAQGRILDTIALTLTPV